MSQGPKRRIYYPYQEEVKVNRLNFSFILGSVTVELAGTAEVYNHFAV